MISALVPWSTGSGIRRTSGVANSAARRSRLLPAVGPAKSALTGRNGIDATFTAPEDRVSN